MASGQQILGNTNIKKDLIKKIIYHQSNLLAVGTKVIETQMLDVLDIRMLYPSDMAGEYPVADDATASREKITWSSFDISLDKGQTHYFITDSAKLRAMVGSQNVINARKASEAMAKIIDKNILGTIWAGAGESVAASTAWTSTSADVESDIVEAWNTILNTSNANMTEMKKMALIVPAAVYARLTALSLIGNVQQTLASYIQNAHGVEIFPTRSDQLGTSASTDALLLIKGGLTGIHGVLSDRAARAAGVPLVESDRQIGSGEDFLVTRWFNTGIIEDGSADGQTDRIVKITGVNP